MKWVLRIPREGGEPPNDVSKQPSIIPKELCIIPKSPMNDVCVQGVLRIPTGEERVSTADEETIMRQAEQIANKRMLHLQQVQAYIMS